MSKTASKTVAKIDEPEIELAADEAETIEFVDPTTMPMPTSVRIGPFVHSIEVMDPVYSIMNSRIGEYDTLQLKISIFEGMPKQRQAETLLHELFHGLFATSGLRRLEDLDEENVVTQLSHGLANLMRDGGDVLAWVMANIQDNK